MTFGVQSSLEESFVIIDRYVKHWGGNFLDTAEMYPAPSSDKKGRWFPGKSEVILGKWLAANPDLRASLVVATKVSGFNPSSETGGNRKLTLGTGGAIDPATCLPTKAPCRLDYDSVIEACDASLKRLQIDTIDLYQVHWPDRATPLFGASGYNPGQERDAVPIAETVRAMKKLIDDGKIKHYGLSNETTYGVCQYCMEADKIGCPRPVSIQNQYSLLYRPFDTELAEACAPSHYNVGLLPWTPLGGGMLTEKYLGLDEKDFPKGSRYTEFPTFMYRFKSPQARAAADKYAAIAKKEGVSLATLSLKFCLSRWFATSTIIGATTLEQLDENCAAFEVNGAPLSDEALAAIDEVHMMQQNPIMSM